MPAASRTRLRWQGLLQYVKANAAPAARDAMMAEPVIGYSIAYPMGVIAVIASILAVKRLWKVDYAAEARQSAGARRHKPALDQPHDPRDQGGNNTARLCRS